MIDGVSAICAAANEARSELIVLAGVVEIERGRAIAKRDCFRDQKSGRLSRLVFATSDINCPDRSGHRSDPNIWRNYPFALTVPPFSMVSVPWPEKPTSR